MARPQLSHTSSDNKIAPVADDALAKSSDQIVDIPNTLGTSRFKVACHFFIKVMRWLLIMFIVGLVPLLVTIVLLVVAFAALTFVQLTRHGDKYDKASQLKFVVRFWLLVANTWLLTVVGSMGLILKHVSGFKQVMFLGLSIASWFNIILPTLFALYYADFFVILSLHRVPPVPLGRKGTRLNFREALFEIVDCLCFVLGLLVVIKQVPNFKQAEILGLYTWKWLMVSALLVISYNVVRLCTHLSAWLIRKLVNGCFDPAKMKNPQKIMLVEKMLPRKYLVYYCNGLKRSITFILCSLLTLFTWVLYIGPHLSKTPSADKILRFGTHTCLSVLICSILWLLKTWVVLSWEATAMYSRLRDQIVDSADQLYFLGILGRDKHDILNLTYYGISIKKEDWSHCGLRFPCFSTIREVKLSYQNIMDFYRNNKTRQWHLYDPIVAIFTAIFEMTGPNYSSRRVTDGEEKKSKEHKADGFRVKKLSAKRRKRTKFDLVMRNRTPTTHDLRQVAHYLISAKGALSEKTFVSPILAGLTADDVIRKKFKQLIGEEKKQDGASSNPRGSQEVLENDEQNASASQRDKNQRENSTNVHPDYPEDDWEYFEKVLLKKESESEISIPTWLEKSRNTCFFTANALSSTKEVVVVLNKIMSFLLIGVTFIIWLLLTRLATTKLLGIIASPFVATAFIFGDTCKTLFQGFMYVYVVHPIHVGDLCSVGGKELVVKAVGIWTTTFCSVEKLGTPEKVTYPNSELANKVVINNLTEFVWVDKLEISLASIHNRNIKELKENIETHLKKKDDKLMPCSHSVVAQGEEGNFMIVIELKYKISKIQNWSKSKVAKRKQELQSDLTKLVQEHNTKKYTGSEASTS